jgi:hypothetical protein
VRKPTSSSTLRPSRAWASVSTWETNPTSHMPAIQTAPAELSVTHRPAPLKPVRAHAARRRVADRDLRIRIAVARYGHDLPETRVGRCSEHRPSPEPPLDILRSQVAPKDSRPAFTGRVQLVSQQSVLRIKSCLANARLTRQATRRLQMLIGDYWEQPFRP